MLLHDIAEHSRTSPLMNLALLGSHLKQIADLTGPQHRRVMHIEGKSCCPAVAPDLLRDSHVVRVGGPHAAVFRWHTKCQEPGIA